MNDLETANLLTKYHFETQKIYPYGLFPSDFERLQTS